jgi:AraC-like DNA-binding protein
MIVVVFYPHTINMFLNTPASAFYNKEISGYDIEDKHLNELAMQVFECEDNNLCVNLIEKWLLSRLLIRPYDTTYRVNRMNVAIEQLCIAPQTHVTELSSTCCLGKKQFEREFYLHVGMNPKEYSRIVRFQKALKQMQHGQGRINQAYLAYSNGYADQSHLIREFKRLCGYTPLSLLEVATPYSDLFTTPV